MELLGFKKYYTTFYYYCCSLLGVAISLLTMQKDKKHRCQAKHRSQLGVGTNSLKMFTLLSCQ